jgi:predicted RNA-binding Zn-ribbon protein involved in translation (DUF1610 family)
MSTKENISPKELNKVCPICTGRLKNQVNTVAFECTECGFTGLNNVDYSKKYDCFVGKKYLNIGKVFRRKHGIDKTFGITLRTRLGKHYLSFKKGVGAMPNQDERLAYQVNSTKICDAIGHGYYFLNDVENGMFKLIKAVT